MTSFQSAHCQVVAWCEYSSSETDRDKCLKVSNKQEVFDAKMHFYLITTYETTTVYKILSLCSSITSKERTSCHATCN